MTFRVSTVAGSGSHFPEGDTVKFPSLVGALLIAFVAVVVYVVLFGGAH